jgi:hypothetical protein
MSTTFPGQFVQTLGQSYGLDNVIPPVFLNGATLTAAGTSFPTLSIPAYNTLWIQVSTPAVGGSDVVSLRFNGDTGANYNSRSDTLVVGSALVTDTPNASDTLIRLGLASTAGRVVFACVTNTLANPKIVLANVAIAGANAATVPITHAACNGVWFNTTAQITSVLCLTQAGQTMAAGSSINIFGAL